MTPCTRTTIRPLAACGIAAMMVALHSLPALADGPLTRRSDVQKQEDADIDKAYRAATRGDRTIPVVKVDPWRAVRPDEDNKKTKP